MEQEQKIGRAHRAWGIGYGALCALLFALCAAPDAYAQTPPDLVLIAPRPVVLQWQDNSLNEDGFSVARNLNSGAWETIFASVGADVTSVTDPGLAQDLKIDNRYCYRAVAFNTSGASNPTNEACAVVKRRLPDDPTNLILLLQQAISNIEQVIGLLK